MKVPSTNNQTPEKTQSPSPKAIDAISFWNLKFGDSLEIGDWDLVL
jgi:hypothetical protein